MSKANNQQNSASAADDRLRRDEASSARGERGVTEDAARANETGLVDNLADIESMLASEFDQVALPTPPQIPGWHLCWLTTGSAYDAIQKRQRLGYQPVVASELPGFETGSLNSAAFPGAITCNEMVLFKIRQERYQAIMKMFHHTRPLAEEESIYNAAQQSEKDSSGRDLVSFEGDGLTQMGKNIERAKAASPVFAP